MKELHFNPTDTILVILKKIKDCPEDSFRLDIPEENVFHQSPLNAKLIQEFARDLGKTAEISPEKPPLPPVKATVKPSRRTLLPLKFTMGTKMVFFTSLGFLLFFCLSLAFVYFYLPRASLTLYVAEREIKKETPLEVIPDLTQLDYQNRQIPGQIIRVEKEGSQKFTSTGKATVGNKATGKVTIYNWSDQEATIQAGTQIKVEEGQEGAGLTFVLNSKEVISAQTLSTPTPGEKYYKAGTVEVDVTATEIGETYNLPKDLSFSVGNYDFAKLYGTSNNQFSGGSTREITVVSQDDQNQAIDTLRAKLEDQIKKDLESKLMGDQQSLPQVVRTATNFSTFSHQIGEETQSFTLHLSLKSHTTVYSQSQLEDLLKNILAENIPDGFKLSSSTLKVSGQPVKIEVEGNLTLMGQISGLVIPDFDQEKLKNQLLGIRPQEAERILKSMAGIQGYKIKLWPRLPEILRTLPHRPERLSIEVEIRD